ncbi:MAG: molybdopterin-dependent oxidoreductase [Dehalococcoidia bacterium]|nr:molybdopterin-dependent oxidoreductase [Dehalococcoidia bacterium]MDP6226552.1 molybdopterin-dependent oxidoreductase [Dehalococcoidia bacterium]MDP7084665.1 molybdopterin-dependent oxidoreductase [Dehalococcoidia bacterium]MDP7200851.1 molybdopterin-dependent oxidoreductase [Dehalococcoidia bacterium]MDP7510758.1 molybdopterin-dependent oxidoreductase [Dehalococcoidia bacterium]
MAIGRREPPGENIVRSVTWSAGPGCHGGCGVLLDVGNGRLEGIEGDPEHPYNRGSLCPRALTMQEYTYHPDRLLHPLRRVGKRGEDRWERVSWDEVFDELERRMAAVKERHGPESMAFIQGTGRDVGAWLLMLAYSYGSPNWLQGGLTGNSCYHPRLGAMKVVQGDYAVPDCGQFLPGRYDDPDFRLPEVIVCWGYNPPATCTDGFYGNWIVDCMKRGTKVIVIDPYYTWTASRAEHWLQIRPGTDGALALGFLHVIIEEGLYDKEFVERWCSGFDKLRQRALEYPPSRVSEITWVPEEQIKAAARLFAAAKPASIQWGVPIDMCPEGFGVAMGVIDLWAITGNIEVPGGMAFAKPAFGVWPYPMDQESVRGFTGNVMDPEVFFEKRVGTKEYPITRNFHWRAHSDVLIDQIFSAEPYPIKAAWIAGNNFLVDGANPKRLLEAFNRLDLIVVVDLFMTPTAAALADFVLPAATFAEKEGVRAWWAPLNAINKAISVAECKPDSEICFELARRFNPSLPWKSMRDFWESLLKPAGVTFEELSREQFMWPDKADKSLPYHRYTKGELRADGNPGFNTPSGKVELYSSLMEQWGHDPLPVFVEPAMSPYSAPELAEEYPLILTTGGRTIAFFHSEHRQIRSLRQIHPYPEVMVHPGTAGPLGIQDGDWVWVENHLGRCKRKVSVTNLIHPRVVAASHGWWFPEKGADEWFGVWDANLNLLIPHNTQSSHGFGGGQYKALLCKLYKADGGIPGIIEKQDLHG